MSGVEDIDPGREILSTSTPITVDDTDNITIENFSPKEVGTSVNLVGETPEVNPAQSEEFLSPNESYKSCEEDTVDNGLIDSLTHDHNYSLSQQDLITNRSGRVVEKPDK